MSFIYSDTKEPFSGSIDFTRINATKKYLEHYENLLQLEFIANNTANRVERAQCEKEMDIARRKMSYWERMPNFSREEMVLGCAKAKEKWKR